MLSKFILLGVLILAVAPISIPPFTLQRTVPSCTRHFEMSADSIYALCSNSSSIHVVKWNSNTQLYEFHQGLYSFDAISGFMQMTEDGLMIGILINYDLLEIYYREPSSDVFESVHSITDKTFHFHISENHQYLAISATSGSLHQFDEGTKKFTMIQQLRDFNDTAPKVSNDGNIVVGMDSNDQIEIAYIPPGETEFSYVNGLDMDLRYRNTEANFKFYPIVYMTGSSFTLQFNFIAMFNASSGELSLIANFTLKNQTGSRVFGEKAEISQNAEYIAFITYSLGSGYALGKLYNNEFTLLTNQTHWEPYNQIVDISFRNVPSMNKQFHTISSQSGTQIYSISGATICEGMVGAITLQYDGSCSCQTNYYWNYEDKRCVLLDCITKQHATGQTNLDGSCVCNQGYHWNYIQKICSAVDCSLDSGSTGIFLSDDYECQCILYFAWEKETERCLPHCLRPLAAQIDPQDDTKCSCRSPAVWNEDIKDCYLPCQDIQFSTGQHQSPEVCSCKTLTYWNESSLACILNCSSIVAAISPSADGRSCVCEDNHNWVPSERKCLRNCAADENWNGEFNRDGSCGCLSGSKWDYVLEKCVSLDCSLFEYTTGEKDAAGECICEEFFAWDSRVKKCIVQCQDIKDGGDSLGTGQNLDAHSCACIEGAAWSSTAARCTRVCSEVPFSTGANVDAENCHCIVAYEWNPVTVSCQISCGSRIGELAEYDDTERHCVCEPTEYYWSQINSACYRDCYLEPFAYPDDGPNPDACNCFLKYKWDAVAKNCVLSCSGFFDTGVSTDGTQCTCQTNSFWSRNAKTCVVDCNKDLLSTKRFIYDRCECKANSQWSDVTNKCECIPGYVFVASTEYCEMQGASGATISISIAGGALISGSLVFAGMKFLQKRRKKQQESKSPVQIAEIPAGGQSLQTQQEIVKDSGDI